MMIEGEPRRAAANIVGAVRGWFAQNKSARNVTPRPRVYLEVIRRQAMVPDHIDDLPRDNDDNRRLMFGLIDDFPRNAAAPAS